MPVVHRPVEPPYAARSVLPRSWIVPLCVLLCVIAGVFVVFGLVYFFVPTTHLPGWFPGHVAAVKRYKVHHATHPSRRRAVIVMVPAVIPLAAAWWLRFRYTPPD